MISQAFVRVKMPGEQWSVFGLCPIHGLLRLGVGYCSRGLQDLYHASKERGHYVYWACYLTQCFACLAETFWTTLNRESTWYRLILISTHQEYQNGLSTTCIPYPTIHQFYNAVFTDLATVRKLYAIHTHISTTSHRSGIPTVLGEISLSWDTKRYPFTPKWGPQIAPKRW